MQRKRIVLSVGGSLIVPNDIDTIFLQQFRNVVKQKVETHQIIIVCGGGKTARQYQAGLSAVQGSEATSEQLDWIGIDASILNARLMRAVLGEEMCGEIITDPRTKVTDDALVAVAAGWKPGHSTDYDAVQLAISNKCGTVINISNISHVYDSDPRNNPNAKPFDQMTWDQYRKLVGPTWTPGMNAPFDPIAAQLAQEHNIRVIIGNGTNMANVVAMVEGDFSTGTVIHNT